MDLLELAALIDVSAVQAQSTFDDIDACVALARRYKTITVFTLPMYAPYLVKALAGSGVLAAGVTGFPSGGESTAMKAAVARELVAAGCEEIDMVHAIALLKADRKDEYIADVRAVVEAADGLPVKVIFECHWLTDDEIVKASQWCVEAGAAWVKTGTGWAPTGATLENVTLMKQTVGDRCKVKAAGGVSSLDMLLAMYDRGVRRFGIGWKTAQAVFTDAEDRFAKTGDLLKERVEPIDDSSKGY